ncbi:MAG: hypothetical protein M1438_01135 [Deltaproteobacteria bacterium]|nr:hypothetical protein [Deltaproteobacteria bacterium]
MKLLKALLRFFLGRYAPKWAAALDAGEAAYRAEDEKEQLTAVEAKDVAMQYIEAKVETEESKAHEEVANAADPNAVVDQQLRELGIITGK